MTIVSVGGISTDVVAQVSELLAPGECRQAEEFHDSVGGKGANQAVAVARLGAPVSLVGAVGMDRRGEAILVRLALDRVDTRHVLRLDGLATGACVIVRDTAGRKQVAVLPGANARVGADAIDEAGQVLRDAAVILVQLEIPIDAALRAAHHARVAGVRLVLDPSPMREIPPALLRASFAVRLNAREAAALTGIEVRNRATARKAAAALHDGGVTLVAVETGDGGNLFATRDEEHLVPHSEVDALDLLGAGDALAAALAVALSENMALRDTALFASAVAALATRGRGAQDGLPARSEVEALLSR